MDPVVFEFYITFGVQYREGGTAHLRGMSADGWAVIEAPDEETARKIANAIFDDQWAFIYTWENFIADGTSFKYHPEGEILRISWKQRGVHS